MEFRILKLFSFLRSAIIWSNIHIWLRFFRQNRIHFLHVVTLILFPIWIYFDIATSFVNVFFLMKLLNILGLQHRLQLYKTLLSQRLKCWRIGCFAWKNFLIGFKSCHFGSDIFDSGDVGLILILHIFWEDLLWRVTSWYSVLLLFNHMILCFLSPGWPT